MIAVLAENNGTVKVWYNRLYDAGMGSEAAESAEFGLSSFSMEHGCVVLVCGFKGNNYFETGGRYIPNVLLTVTEDCAAHVWVENLAQVCRVVIMRPCRARWSSSSWRP
ncbi:MAG: hypothetical protein P4M11_03015 [Candidatus Pacebacteria bacterium]|nr:hypothetical protein [Candidatus Paceibacterota bacterium]